MSQKSARAEARRTQILDAATQVFSRRGLHATRMDDVVQESGLSKGALYWYFKSKDDLILGILNHLLDAEMKNMKQKMLQAGSAEQQLQAMHEAFSKDMNRWSMLLPLILDFYALASRNRKVRRMVLDRLGIFQELLCEIITDGIHAGDFRDLDAKQTALTIISYYEGMIAIASLDPGAQDWKKQSEIGINLLIQGLRKTQA